MSTKHRSRSRRSSSNRLEQNNNVTVIKLLDPIVQSVLIVLFIYCVDDEKLMPYRAVFFFLIIWQLLSTLLHFFFNGLKLLKNERFMFFVVMVLYMGFFVLFEKYGREHYISLDEVSKPTIPLHRLITMSIAIALAFWYNIICYREIRTMLRGVINRGRG